MTKTGLKDGMAAVLKHYAEYGIRAKELKIRARQSLAILLPLCR